MFHTAELMFPEILIDIDATWNNINIHADENFQES